MSTYFEQFMAHLKNERNLSPTTLIDYRFDITKFMQHCPSLSKEEITKWRAFLTDTVAPKTHIRYLAAAKGFTRWLKREGIIPDDPLAGSDAPKLAKTAPPYLTLIQSEAIIATARADEAQAKGSRKRQAQRNVAILELLAASGLRLQEVVALDRLDIMVGDDERIVLKVRNSKGYKDRYVPLAKRAAKVLIDYIERGFSNRPEGCDAVFLTSAGRISKREVQRMITRYGKDAGVPASCCHAHAFRVGLATRLHEAGMDIYDVSKMLGHERISTTEGYVVLNLEHLKRSFRAVEEKI